MMKQRIVLTYFLFVWGAFGAWMGCTAKHAVRQSDQGANQVTQAAKKQLTKRAERPCIRGKVVDDKNKGVAYVFVRTEPKTTPAVTDASGFFEFCFQRITGGSDTVSQKRSLKAGKYTIFVKKEGFKARPLHIQFAGRTTALQKIVLLEKVVPLGEVQNKAKPKEEKKLPSGITGSFPKGG